MTLDRLGTARRPQRPIARASVLVAAALLLVALSFTFVGVGSALALPAHPGPAQSGISTTDPTSTNLFSNNAVATPGATVTLTAYVTDTSATPSTPSGVVSWADQGAGGNFSSPQCTLSSASSSESQCSISYIANAPVGANVTILGSYAGDAGHASSAGVYTVQVLSLSATSVSPSSRSITSGQTINFTVTVTDSSTGASNSPQGEVSWSSKGGGGFVASLCSLAQISNFSSACTVTFHAPFTATTALSLQISASYPGDSRDSPSSGSATLTDVPATVPVTVSYSAVGSGQPLPPTFTYSISNGTKTVEMTSTPTSYEVDVGSEWFVSNQLENSSQTDAWNLDGAAQGTVQYAFGTTDGGSFMTFTYYHQYRVDLGYQVVGGTAGASIPPFVTFTSFGVTKDTGAPGQVWVDVGTPYAYPALIPGSIGNVRWIAQNVSGAVTGPGDLSPTYYHQYYLSVSFAVRDTSGSQTPPTFFAESMGLPFNESVASLTSNLWLDAGSSYSLTDPLAGANSTVRWSAGSSSSGAIINSNIAVTYYRQYPVIASFKTADGSVPAKLIRGVSTPVFAALEGVSGDANVTVPLTTQPQVVWLNAGTVCSIPNLLLALSGERWMATGAVTGTVAPGGTLLQTFYHEFLLNVSYIAPGPPVSAPSLTYTLLGNQTQSPLVEQNMLIANSSAVWVDSGTHFFVMDSSPGERWYAPSAPDGLASSTMAVTFYHQYKIDVSLGVVGGGLPAQSSVSGTSGGKAFTELLGTQIVGVWLDSGTNFTIPQTLLQLPTERWVAASDMTRDATSPTAVTQLYYHQALLNLSASGAPSASPPAIGYVSMGERTNAIVGQASSAIWADVGTGFNVQNVIGGGTGERWYSGLIDANVTGPIQEAVRYFHQYSLNYSYALTGGQMTPLPALTIVQAGKSIALNATSQTGQFWADAGTQWQAAATPAPPGERWLSGAPTHGTVAGPASLRFSYFLQFLVSTAASPASGGSVTPGGWFNASSDVTLQAVPGLGWALGNWNAIGAGGYSGTSSTVSIHVLSAANETAQFEPGLTIVSSNGGSVKYTTGPSVQNVGPGRSVQTFVTGNGQVTLEAHASFPFQFVTWSGIDGNSSDPLSLSVNAPTVIQAVFAPSYMDLIGFPAAVFASCLTIYLARHVLLATGRQALRNVRRGRS